jgi:hypothetical protein
MSGIWPICRLSSADGKKRLQTPAKKKERRLLQKEGPLFFLPPLSYAFLPENRQAFKKISPSPARMRYNRNTTIGIFLPEIRTAGRPLQRGE